MNNVFDSVLRIKFKYSKMAYTCNFMRYYHKELAVSVANILGNPRCIPCIRLFAMLSRGSGVTENGCPSAEGPGFELL